MPPHAFALVDGRLDYGRFERVDSGLRLALYRSLELPADAFQSGRMGGPPSDPAGFRSQIAELVKSLEVPVKAASLVLPDAWLRIVFSETEELPRNGKEREEMLRFKLKRLVPFRVEDLRVEGVDVAPLAGQEAPYRVLLAFGVEQLLSHLEAAFAEAGVRLGQISNHSLSVLAGYGRAAAGDGLESLALVGSGGYALIFCRRGEPVLHRYKSLNAALTSEAVADLVVKDLRLTASFLEQQFPDRPLERAVLLAPPEIAPFWWSWLSDGLGTPVEELSPEHLPQVAGAEHLDWTRVVPLIGAVSQEVQ